MIHLLKNKLAIGVYKRLEFSFDFPEYGIWRVSIGPITLSYIGV